MRVPSSWRRAPAVGHGAGPRPWRTPRQQTASKHRPESLRSLAQLAPQELRQGIAADQLRNDPEIPTVLGVRHDDIAGFSFDRPGDKAGKPRVTSAVPDEVTVRRVINFPAERP